MSRTSPALMRATEAAAAPAAPKPGKKNRKPKITRLVREACELLASGEARTITDAATMLNCTREHISKQLQKDHVNDYLTLAAKRKISGQTLKAAHVKVGLLDAANEKVRSDVASEVLAIAGIVVPKNGHSINIQNNVTVSAGYILNATGKTEAEVRPLIDAEYDVVAT